MDTPRLLHVAMKTAACVAIAAAVTALPARAEQACPQACKQAAVEAAEPLIEAWNECLDEVGDMSKLQKKLRSGDLSPIGDVILALLEAQASSCWDQLSEAMQPVNDEFMDCLGEC